MNQSGPVKLGNLERDLGEALAAESPAPAPGCPGLAEMLDAIESVDAGGEPGALAHIATCSRCRREYLALRESFTEADRLRVRRLTEQHPDPRGAFEALRQRLDPPFQAAYRFGLAGAAALAMAVLGYVIGAGTVHEAPPPPATSQPAPDVQAQVDRLNAEVSSARAENRRLKRLAVKPPAPAALRPVAPAVPASRPPAPSRRLRVSRVVTVIRPVVRSVAGLGRPPLKIVAPPGLIERGGDASTAVSPAGTWVLSDHPVFQCRFPGATPHTRYAVRLRTPSGDTLTVVKTGEALRWRPDTLLPRGVAIDWTVSATVGDHAYAAAGRFGVLTADEASRVVRLASRVKGLARALVYRRAGLLPEAAAVLEQVRPSSRDIAAARRELAEIREAMQPRVEWSQAEAPEPAAQERGEPASP